MDNKIVSLYDMVKLSDNEELSEPYIGYICGMNHSHQYRHQEILDIQILINSLHIPLEKQEGFIYGYVVPQLNKEFDLIKITSSTCLNIELKSDIVPNDKIKRQLIQNLHYLKLLNKEKLKSYLFISSNRTVFTLDESNEPKETTLDDLLYEIELLSEGKLIDLDKIFTPNNILVSPLNSTDRFLKKDYLLTENQENIKKQLSSMLRPTRKVGLQALQVVLEQEKPY